MITAGADGCRGGWVLALFDGQRFDIQFAADFAAVQTLASGADAIAVDMPVALSGDGTPRRCDSEARRLLGKRASTIFPAPPKALLDFTNYQEALAASRRLYGRGLSVQTFHLFPKIREVQQLEGVLEIHPELAFLAMNGGQPLPGKKTPEGTQLRERLLKTVPQVTIRGAKRDDILDAAAVAWSALRYVRGQAVRLGDAQSAIWY